MTANSRRGIAAGFNLIFYGINDTDGSLLGGDLDGAAAGNVNGSPMRQLVGAKTIPLTVPESENVVATGDDVALAQFLFAAASLPAGVLETAVADLDFEALVQGTLVEDIDEGSLGIWQPETPMFEDIGWIMQSRDKSFDDGSVGAKQWSGVIIPSSTVTPLGRNAFTERAVASQRYGVSVNNVDMMPWAATLTDATNGVRRATMRPFRFENPIHQHVFKGNNSATGFMLAYEPVSSEKVSVWVNGVKQTLTTHYTVNTTTWVVTFVSAPGSNAKIVVLYEFVKN